MKINLKQAIKYFFHSPSLEMVYIEAIANSLDANASKIDIEILLEQINKPKTLEIIIRDNGEGFTDKRFSKFAELMKVEDDGHKGLGRLVFLSYFNKVNVISRYNKKKRTFEYSTNFDERSDLLNEANQKEMGLLFKILLDYALFAFFINFIREIAKDAQDAKGDYNAGIKTTAIDAVAIGLEEQGLAARMWD